MSANGLEKKQAGKAGVAGRAFRRLAVLVPVAVFLSAGPAFAHEKLTITHQPPLAVVEGSDAELIVAVHREGHPQSSLSRTYGQITVKAHYQSGGRTKTVSAELDRKGGAVRLTIPGRDVEARMLRYWLTASQKSCVGLWSRRLNCEILSVRAPEQGTYVVPVASAEPEEASRPSRQSLTEDAEALRNQAVKWFPPPPK